MWGFCWENVRIDIERIFYDSVYISRGEEKCVNTYLFL